MSDKIRQNKRKSFNEDGSLESNTNSNGTKRIRETKGHKNGKKHRNNDKSKPFSRNKNDNNTGNSYKTINFNSDDEGEDFEEPSDDDDLEYDTEEENEKLLSGKKNYINKKELKSKAEELLKIRKTLPVYKVKDQVVQQLLKSRVNILIGETGSGKSTQIPQFLMKHSEKKIAVTQPRRVAAINLATRVAEEYGCQLGKDVGYSVRFNNMSNKRLTKLKYITDGMLLREMMLDPLLSSYSTIIIDEAHERTILTDLLLGFLKDLLIDKRKDDVNFKIIIMSATIDAEKFSKFFNDAPILFVEGKMYPVEKYYLSKSSDDIIDSTVTSIVQINQSELQGDILCFLPGQEDIDKIHTILTEISPLLPREAPLIVSLPLYAALPSHLQMKIFEPVKKNQRKIILSTNIAETSVTIPGIKYVIDTGLRKLKVWRHQLGLSTLLTTPISKASATQRSGRAGRESGGKCFRLYKENDYLKLNDSTEPEILRSDIISPVLMLKRLGVHDILNWFWLENPDKESLINSLRQLYSLQALNDSGKITELGEKLVVLPVQPHLATVLITSIEYDCLDSVIDIVSCLSVENLLLTPSNEKRDEINEKRRDLCILGNKYGDLIMFKELFNFFNSLSDNMEKKKWCNEIGVSYKGFKNVLRIKRQLKEYMNALILKKDNKLTNLEDLNDLNDGGDDDDFGLSRKEKESINTTNILKSFLKGFISNTAMGMPDRSYRTVTNGDLVSIHPSSLLFGQKKDAIMYIEYVYTVKGYARNVSAVELDWLQEVAPHLLSTQKVSAN
ncbi:hypothetical protein B5S31_g560 [[Candida] boidinii]|nr:hypothetical protein B5S31_g560 [[Candida] boidinii]